MAFRLAPHRAPCSASKSSWPACRGSICRNPVPITKSARGAETDAVFGGTLGGEQPARRLSYHTDFSNFTGPVLDNPFRNPITNKGPMEGRPPGGLFPHQRSHEFYPHDGHVTS